VPSVQAAASSFGLSYGCTRVATKSWTVCLARIGALVIGTDPFFTSRVEKVGATSLHLAIPAITIANSLLLAE
jgi:hypothetical protein